MVVVTVVMTVMVMVAWIAGMIVAARRDAQADEYQGRCHRDCLAHLPSP
jgi:hypothetical protein